MDGGHSSMNIIHWRFVSTLNAKMMDDWMRETYNFPQDNANDDMVGFDLCVIIVEKGN